jgi:hypothetical protein
VTEYIIEAGVSEFFVCCYRTVNDELWGIFNTAAFAATSHYLHYTTPHYIILYKTT